MADPGGHRPSIYQEWLYQMHSDLNNGRLSSEANVTPHIYRVPRQIREVSEQSFGSNFSFGLYDLETRNKSELDPYRKGFAATFMQISGREWQDICSKVVGDSPEKVESWVKLYHGLSLESIIAGRANGSAVDEARGAGDMRSSTLDLIRYWLTVDAIFIVCFIQADHQSRCHRCREKFPALNRMMEDLALKSIVHMIRLDIFKFENQIPLSLIRNVVTMMFNGNKSLTVSDGHSERNDPFRKFVVNAVSLIYCNLPGPRRPWEFERSVNSTNIDDSRHLLQCLYSVVCHSPGREEPLLDSSFTIPQETNAEGNAGLAEPSAGDPPGTGRDEGQAEFHTLTLAPEVANTGTNTPHQNDAGGGHTAQKRRRKKNSKGSHHHHINYQNRLHLPSTVTQLKEADIRVTQGQGNSKAKWISDVKFECSTFQGKLYLPSMGIYDETESLLRNLLVYEYVVAQDEKTLLSFVHLMDNLMDTKEDVRMLTDSGVLTNHSLAGDEDVAHMWSTMLTGVVLTLSPQYQKVYDEILPYYHNKVRKLGENLRTIHRKWILGGTVFVLISLICTLVSTFYTVLTYYWGNKQRAQT